LREDTERFGDVGVSWVTTEINSYHAFVVIFLGQVKDLESCLMVVSTIDGKD